MVNLLVIQTQWETTTDSRVARIMKSYNVQCWQVYGAIKKNLITLKKYLIMQKSTAPCYLAILPLNILLKKHTRV